MSKKQDPPVKKNAFVHKLYTMLNDPKLSQLIWWSNNASNTFALYPGKEFANALTGYFKHGNVASFVRQLHMYGFHKVSDPNNTPPIDKDTPPVWEFKHLSGKFKKDDESSLIYIKRRSSSNSSRNSYGSEQPLHTEYLQAPTSTESYYSQQHYIPYYPMANVPNMAQPMHQPMHHQPNMPQPMHHQPNMPPNMPPMHPQNPQQMHPQNIHPMHQQPYPYPMQAPHYQYPDYPHSLPHPYYDPSQIKRPPTAYTETQHPPPVDEKRHHSDPALRSVTPSTTAPSQHYTPNLQFRKIWENDSSNATRSRNPSLKFDPLAPANAIPPVNPVNPLNNVNPTNNGGAPGPAQAQATPAPPAAAAAAVTPVGAPPLSRTPVPMENGSPFPRPESSTSMASSIKLPPPSSIQRPSSLAYPHSPDSSRNDSPAAPHPPRSLPNSSSPSQIAYVATLASIPDSIHKANGNGAKKPSLPASVLDKLRPSLIELHFGSGAGLKNPQNDSIGSHSSYNLIFSNGSSLSSTASVKRTSSFGSISSHPAVVDSQSKSSFSIGPHDPLPAPAEIVQPLATRWLELQTVTQPVSNPYYGLQQFQSPRSSSPGSGHDSHRLVTSLTPPPSKLNPKPSPIVRSSSSIPAFSSVTRSLNTSPLTKNVEPKTKKVSVTSLLDDGPSNGHKKSILNAIIDESSETSDDTDSKKRRLS